MFDFEKLDVYTQARTYVKQVLDYLSSEDLGGDPYLLKLLKKSAIRIPVLIAEGVGRMVPEEKRQSYKTARSALFESVATLHLLRDLKQISPEKFEELYHSSETLSRMLLGLIRSQ